MLVQEWVHGIEYKKRILAFLYKIDDIMVPALRGRVDIPSYAEKISQKAETIFISENGYKLFYIFNFSTISTTSLWTSSIDLVESTTLTLSGSDFAISR